MMKLYVIGRCAYQSGMQPQYELYATKDDYFFYLGSGPRIAVELLKRFISINNEETIELVDISNEVFEQILKSVGFEKK